MEGEHGNVFLDVSVERVRVDGDGVCVRPGVSEGFEAREAGVELHAAVEALDERAQALVVLLEEGPPRRQVAPPGWIWD